VSGNNWLSLAEVEEVLQLSRYRLRTLCANGHFKSARKNFLKRWEISESEVLAEKGTRAAKRKEAAKSNKYYIRPSARAIRMVRRCVASDSKLSKEQKKAFGEALDRYDKLFTVMYESSKR